MDSHGELVESKEETGTSKRKALIMGISEYSNLERLDSCKNDGQEVYNTLKSIGYKIDNDRPIVGKIDKEDLEKKLKKFFLDPTNKPEDILLFYFSGHGVVDTSDEKMYIASSGVDPEEPIYEGFSLEQLRDIFDSNRCIPDKIIVILDCCYSGAINISNRTESMGQNMRNVKSDNVAAALGKKTVDKELMKHKERQGIYILTASQATQEAYIKNHEFHSVFTGFLLEGLKGNPEAVNNDGNITFKSLYNFIRRSINRMPVEKRPKQTPSIRTELEDIIIAHYPYLKQYKTDDDIREPKQSRFFIPIVVGIPITAILIISILFLTLSNGSHNSLVSNNSSIYSNIVSNGNRLDTRSNYTEAIKYYDKALAINPKDIDVLTAKCLDYNNMFNYSGAIKCFDKVLAINPKDLTVLQKMGNAQNSNENYPEAIKYYDKALAINPIHINSLKGKGSSLAFLKNYPEAIKYYDKALAINPNDFTALRKKADVLLVQKNYPEAIKYYDKALVINPKDTSALKGKDSALNSLNYTGVISATTKY